MMSVGGHHARPAGVPCSTTAGRRRNVRPCRGASTRSNVALDLRQDDTPPGSRRHHSSDFANANSTHILLQEQRGFPSPLPDLPAKRRPPLCSPFSHHHRDAVPAGLRLDWRSNTQHAAVGLRCGDLAETPLRKVKHSGLIPDPLPSNRQPTSVDSDSQPRHLTNIRIK